MLRSTIAWLHDAERRLPPAARWIPVLLVVGLLLAELLLYHWPLGTTFYTCDAHEVVPAARAYGRWLAGTLTIDDLVGVRVVDQPPPLFHALQLVYYIVSDTHRGVVLVNIVPAAIISAAVFGIVARRYGRGLGLLAVILTWSSPEMVSLLCTRLGVELMLSALVIAALLFLFECDDFRDRRRAFMLGVMVGLAGLTKLSFALFLAAPLLYVLVRAATRRHRWRRLANAGIAAGVAAALSAPWYLLNAGVILTYSAQETIDSPLGGRSDTVAARVVNLADRLHRSAGTMPLVLLGVLLLLAAVVAWRRRGGRPGPKGDLVILLSPLLTVLLFSVALRTAESCLLYVEFAAAAPAVAVATCALIAALPWPQLRTAAVLLTVVIAVATHVHAHRRIGNCVGHTRLVASASRSAASRVRRDAAPGRPVSVAVRVTAPETRCMHCRAAHWAYFSYFTSLVDDRVRTCYLNFHINPEPPPLDTPGHDLVIEGVRHDLRVLDDPDLLERRRLDYVLLWHGDRRPQRVVYRDVSPSGPTAVSTGVTVFSAVLGDKRCQLVWLPPAARRAAGGRDRGGADRVTGRGTGSPAR